MSRSTIITLALALGCSSDGEGDALTFGSVGETAGQSAGSGASSSEESPDADTGSSEGGDELPPTHSPGCGADPPAMPLGSVTVGGQQRTFLLDLPNGYSPDVAYPVVFGWHGTGHQASNARQQMKLRETSGDTAIAVYPNGSTQAPVWQFPGGAGVTDQNRDLEFFDAMVEGIGDAYCIDGAMIFSTGFSQGAYLTNSLACERPWAVRGIAPVAGGGPWFCDPVPMAAMVIIGANDNIAGQNADLGYNNSAQRSRDFWVQGSGCTETSSAVDPSPCVQYDCPDDTPVRFCEWSGGHQWWQNASLGMLLFFSSL